MKVHTFSDRSDVGLIGERMVARHLESLGFIVKAVGQGVEGSTWEAGSTDFTQPDFLIEGHVSGTPSALTGKLVEVKSDERGDETGNAVLELISNVSSGRQGWVYSTKADYLAFLYLPSRRLFLMETAKLRESLKTWQHGKPFKCRNEIFSALGILVPIPQIAAISIYQGVVDD